MMGDGEGTTPSHRAIARAFVEARLAATALPGFPGAMPATLAEAYAVQRCAIALWPDAVAGWKVARIAPAFASAVGAERMIGPIFARTIVPASAATPFPIVEGGAGALEAEIVVVLAHDVPPRSTTWTAREARALVGSAHVGIEVAGSPLAGIGTLGPVASVCGMGNNIGLILGDAIATGARLDTDIACVCAIDDRIAGRGVVAADMTAPLEALAFTLNHAAGAGIALRAGHLVSTGAITGVHPIRIGETGTATFGDLGAIRCHGEKARPADRRATQA